MHLLVVAATEGELSSLDTGAIAGRGDVEVVITGAGMVATAAQVSRALARTRFDLAINLGVCGAFDRALALGSVVHVTSDRLPELGVEDGRTFVPAETIGLVDADTPPFTGGCLINAAPPASITLEALPRVRAITVNTVHGDEASIAAVVGRHHPQVESMEGAAFMYACLIAGVPFVQLRAVSNYVERRDRAAWKLPEAIASLGRVATALIREVGAR